MSNVFQVKLPNSTKMPVNYLGNLVLLHDSYAI